jgi:hypothetical protein
MHNESTDATALERQLDAAVPAWREIHASPEWAQAPPPGAMRQQYRPPARTYTREQIRQNYLVHHPGGFVGREAEWHRLELDMIAAGREGRVRTWTTRYRGPLLIHAGQLWHDETIADIERPHRIAIPRDLQLGGIVGIVDLVDVVTQSDDPYFYGPPPPPQPRSRCGGNWPCRFF